MCELCRYAGLDYLVHNLGFQMVQLVLDFSNYMVCVTPMGQLVQHLWETIGLLHPLFTRVLLLILERWVVSWHLVFTGWMYKNPINIFHVFGAMILAKDLVSSCHYSEVTVLLQKILWYIWYNSPCSCIYQLFIPQYRELSLICLSPFTGNKICLIQLAVYMSSVMRNHWRM